MDTPTEALNKYDMEAPSISRRFDTSLTSNLTAECQLISR